MPQKIGTDANSAFSITMALSLLLSGLVLAPYVQAQAFDTVDREEGAFSYVQPLNTTILTQYGSSPAVLPSRNLPLPIYIIELY
jgi:hypothetical protein